jgi:hypothetical protein
MPKQAILVENANKRLPVTPKVWELLSDLKRPGETFDHLLREMIAHEQAFRLTEELDRIEKNNRFTPLEELDQA